MLSYIEIIFRWIFALQMIFWGLNGFFEWVKIPPASKGVEKFVQACADTKFILPTVKFIEIFCGGLLLNNIFVPLSLAAFAPIIFGIVMLHAFHNPKPWAAVLPVGIPYLVIVILNIDVLMKWAR